MIILKVRSGQNHDNKIAPQAQANFNPTAAIIMDLLSSLNNTFSACQRIIFSQHELFLLYLYE